MDVKRKLTYIFRLCLPLLLLLNACDDMEDKPFTSSDITGDPTETDTAELYALCEGLFNQNNSSLMRFSFNNQRMVRNYFKTINHRGLGDTANDLAIYGSKIYIVANVSSTIEIVDFQTGNSLKQIQMLTENGNPREPRYIAFHKEKAYVCSYDGTVARIDTASLAIDAMTTVGRNPDGICVQDDKLYVSNSGGLDHASGLGVDNTVSVVDIATFKETDKIIVGPNPGKIIADTKEKVVYVATRGEDVEAGDYNFAKIDCRTKVVTHYNERVQNFAIDGEIAYLYNYNYSTQTASIKTFNLKTGETVRENFITDGTNISTPYGINVNPYSGNIYITDAYDYTVYGDLLCFNQQGQLLFRLNNIGLNPNTIVFSDKASRSDIDALVVYHQTFLCGVRMDAVAVYDHASADGIGQQAFVLVEPSRQIRDVFLLRGRFRSRAVFTRLFGYNRLNTLLQFVDLALFFADFRRQFTRFRIDFGQG